MVYARHGRDLMGCKSPVFNSGTFFGRHHTRWIARKKSTRGEGNCGEVTDRGEEACDARSPSQAAASRQDPPGDEQKLDTRPTTIDERAADREVEPEEVA